MTTKFDPFLEMTDSQIMQMLDRDPEPSDDEWTWTKHPTIGWIAKTPRTHRRHYEQPEVGDIITISRKDGTQSEHAIFQILNSSPGYATALVQ